MLMKGDPGLLGFSRQPAQTGVMGPPAPRARISEDLEKTQRTCVWVQRNHLKNQAETFPVEAEVNENS